MPKVTGTETHWTFGGYYLDRPHPGRGGSWYACRYEPGSRRVARRSLHTTDFEEAKRALISQAAVAPLAPDEAPHPKHVLTVTVLAAYRAGRGAEIRSAAYAERAAHLVTEFFAARGLSQVPASFWTPSRQMDFARYLHEAHGHKASTIERTFNVIGAAMHDAARVKIRPTPLGEEVEGSIMSHAPVFALKKTAIARELRLPDPAPKIFVPTLEEMARFIDALQTTHLRRWALIALSTWGRPEAITDFDPAKQWDRRTGLLDLNPPGRPQTNKRRAMIPCPRALAGSLPLWQEADMAWRRMRGRAQDDPWFPLMYKSERVGSVKSAVKRIAAAAGVPGITQKTPRTFMTTMVRKLCPQVTRERRSLWLGHVVAEGSRTTSHYEIADAEYLADVALATDYVLQRLHELCRIPFLAIEVRLKPPELARIGVARRPRGKSLINDKIRDGGRDRD